MIGAGLYPPGRVNMFDYSADFTISFNRTLVPGWRLRTQWHEPNGTVLFAAARYRVANCWAGTVRSRREIAVRTRDPQLAVGERSAAQVVPRRRRHRARPRRRPALRARRIGRPQARRGVGSGQRGSWPRSTAPHSSVAATAAGEHFWSALPPGDQTAMLAAGSMRTYARGQALMLQEQMPDAVIVLRRGQVKVSRSTITGREVVLAIRGPGELLGELTAIDGRPRSASVVALEPVDALVLSPHTFRVFLAEPSRRLAGAAGDAHRRLRDADVKRAGLSSLTTLSRVAERLLELADRFGIEEEGYTRIELRLSQDELAGWVGASIESVAAPWPPCARCTGSRRAAARSACSTSTPCGARPADHVI